jgi:ACR3 family arsenite transporter
MSVVSPGQVFSALGRHGPILLVLSLVAGTTLPRLAAVAHSILPMSAFLLTLGSFLKAGLSPREDLVHLRLTLATAAWAGLGVPLIAACGLAQAHFGRDTQSGVLLSVLAPPVGSAAAIAAILGLQPRLALMASILLTILAPFSMPLLATALGSEITIDMYFVARRLAIIIGAAGVIAAIALRWRRQTSWMLPNNGAAAGVAVIGLVIVGLATTDGIRASWHADPHRFLQYAVAAALVNVAITVLSAGLFTFAGLRTACTVGLVSGNRNVTLAWAAAGGTLSTFTEAYVAACVIPILSLPLLIKSGFMLLNYLPAKRRGDICIPAAENSTLPPGLKADRALLTSTSSPPKIYSESLTAAVTDGLRKAGGSGDP